MLPISDISAPAIAAASAVLVRYCVNCLPGFIPAATAFAAVVAASPIPNDVPLTDSSALSIIVFVSLALLPNADNLRSEEHTSELHSRFDLVCRLLLE